MQVHKFCRMLALGAVLLPAAPAFAQICTGFTDVPAGDPFCANIQWIKNRGITLGCAVPPAPSAYCPTQNVVRNAMAAFMNRLGTALTPVELGAVANDSVTPIPIATASVRCQTPLANAYTVTGYPRRAVFNNKANFSAPTGRLEIVADAVYSTDSGATWIAVTDSQTYQTVNAGLNPPDDVTTYQLGYLNLTVGLSYQFAVRVQSIGGTGNVRVYCANRVQIVNRNGDGTLEPYDEVNVQPPEERTGRAAIPPVH